MAKELLAEGGSAVDAAVGALVCDGLYNPQVSVYSEYPGYIAILMIDPNYQEEHLF